MSETDPAIQRFNQLGDMIKQKVYQLEISPLKRIIQTQSTNQQQQKQTVRQKQIP